MAALILIVIAAIVVIAGTLFGGFVAICRSIHRTDRWGNLHPETSMPHGTNLLVSSSRWDRPAYA